MNYCTIKKSICSRNCKMSVVRHHSEGLTALFKHPDYSSRRRNVTVWGVKLQGISLSWSLVMKYGAFQLQVTLGSTDAIKSYDYSLWNGVSPVLQMRGLSVSPFFLQYTYQYNQFLVLLMGRACKCLTSPVRGCAEPAATQGMGKGTRRFCKLDGNPSYSGRCESPCVDTSNRSESDF